MSSDHRLQHAVVEAALSHPHIERPIINGRETSILALLLGERCQLTFYADERRWCRLSFPQWKSPVRECVEGLRDAVRLLADYVGHDLYTVRGAVIHIGEDIPGFEVCIFYSPVENAVPANRAALRCGSSAFSPSTTLAAH